MGAQGINGPPLLKIVTPHTSFPIRKNISFKMKFENFFLIKSISQSLKVTLEINSANEEYEPLKILFYLIPKLTFGLANDGCN